MAKKEEIKTKLEKCPYCKKKTVTFYIHECERSMSEYYGCNKCDDWCVHCNKEWADGTNKKG